MASKLPEPRGAPWRSGKAKAIDMSIGAETEIIDHGIITRTHSFPETKHFIGCVHYATGELCGRSRRPSEGVMWKPIDQPLAATRREALPFVDARVVYAGHLPSHFGHFLLETPARFWFFARSSHWDYLVFNRFVTGDAIAPEDEKLQSLLASFAIDSDRVRILDRDTQFSTVIVPSALFAPGAPVPPMLADVYRRWRAHLLQGTNLDGPRRIYLSRRKFENDRAESGVDEARLESFLEEYAFTVIHPESLPFAEQARLVASAQAVAGLGGSALHLSVFMQPDALTLVIGTHRWPGPNRVQITCNELSNARVAFYPFSGKPSSNPAFRFEIDWNDLRRFVSAQLTT